MMSQRLSQQWQLGENNPEAYESYLVPIMFAPWAERLIELVAPEAGERVLDVACGTGVVTRHAAPRVGSGGTVVGLDISEGMLEVARAASSDIRPQIEWRNGDAIDMPLPDEAFDVVVCQQGLQFFEDRSLALREMHRVLVPNGRLGLSVWRPIEYSPGYLALAETLERHVGAEAGAAVRVPFCLSDSVKLRNLMAGAGFRDVRIHLGIGSARFPSPAEFLWRYAVSYPPLTGPIGALGGDIHEALIHDLGEALRAYTDDNGIVFPMETYIAVARR